MGLVAEAIRDDEFASLFDSTLVRGRWATFEVILRRGQQREQIRPDADVDVAIDALYGAIHHRLLITRRPIDAAFVAALVDVTARGLAPGQPRHSSAKP